MSDAPWAQAASWRTGAGGAPSTSGVAGSSAAGKPQSDKRSPPRPAAKATSLSPAPTNAWGSAVPASVRPATDGPPTSVATVSFTVSKSWASAVGSDGKDSRERRDHAKETVSNTQQAAAAAPTAVPPKTAAKQKQVKQVVAAIAETGKGTKSKDGTGLGGDRINLAVGPTTTVSKEQMVKEDVRRMMKYEEQKEKRQAVQQRQADIQREAQLKRWEKGIVTKASKVVYLSDMLGVSGKKPVTKPVVDQPNSASGSQPQRPAVPPTKILAKTAGGAEMCSATAPKRELKDDAGIAIVKNRVTEEEVSAIDRVKAATSKVSGGAAASRVVDATGKQLVRLGGTGKPKKKKLSKLKKLVLVERQRLFDAHCAGNVELASTAAPVHQVQNNEGEEGEDKNMSPDELKKQRLRLKRAAARRRRKDRMREQRAEGQSHDGNEDGEDTVDAVANNDNVGHDAQQVVATNPKDKNIEEMCGFVRDGHWKALHLVLRRKQRRSAGEEGGNGQHEAGAHVIPPVAPLTPAEKATLQQEMLRRMVLIVREVDVVRKEQRVSNRKEFVKYLVTQLKKERRALKHFISSGCYPMFKVPRERVVKQYEQEEPVEKEPLSPSSNCSSGTCSSTISSYLSSHSSDTSLSSRSASTASSDSSSEYSTDDDSFSGSSSSDSASDAASTATNSTLDDNDPDFEALTRRYFLLPPTTTYAVGGHPLHHVIDQRPQQSSARREVVREYVTQCLTPTIDTLSFNFLLELTRLQRKLKQTQPQKFKKQVRYVSGLRQILRGMKATAGRRVLALFVAPDVEVSSAEGGLNDVVRTLIATAADHRVPVVFALNKMKIAEALMLPVKRGVRVSAVGIFSSAGAHEILKNLIECKREADVEYLRLVAA